MNRTTVRLLAFVVFAGLGLAPTPGISQDTGAVTGIILDGETGLPLPGAQIYLEGSTMGALTNQQGAFRLDRVPAGPALLRVLLLGFSPLTESVNVREGETVVLEMRMVRTAIALDEIVVTATGEQRKRELGTVVGTIDAEQRLEAAPITNAYDLLQGQSPGVQIITVGGTIGSGQRIRIRGSNSLNLSNEPVIYLDGVRIESSSGTTVYTGGQDPGRLNDINPEDIASVEVVKGPAASALYGTQAANGVIRITTKRGRPGPARWTVFAEGGVNSDPHTYPDNWESRGPDNEYCRVDFRADGRCASVAETYRYTPLEDDRFSPLATGYRQKYGGNVSGGSDRITYYLSGDWENETGPYRLPDFYADQLNTAGLAVGGSTERPQQLTRVNLRGTLGVELARNTVLNLSGSYVTSNLSMNDSDNSGLGMLASAYLGGARRPESADDDENVWLIVNPGQTFGIDLLQDVERYTTSGTLNWRPLSWLEVRGTAGADVTTQRDIRHVPRELSPFQPTGYRMDSRAQVFQYTGDLGGSASVELTPAITSRTSFGVQYLRDLWTGVGAEGEDLVPGTRSVSAAAVTTSVDATEETRTLGIYVEENLAFSDNLFLSAGLRLDDNSAFGKQFKAALYPKASLSWVPSAADWFPSPSWLTELRLRSAWGESGVRPGTNAAIRRLSPVAFTHPESGASESGVTIANVGNNELRPETSREFEVGGDLDLFNGRMGAELTYYLKQTEDALVNRPLPPSMGAGAGRWENLASVRNSGWEAGITATVFEQAWAALDLALSGSVNHNELVSLGEGIEPFGSRQRAVEGFAIYGFWAQPYTYEDTNGDGIIAVEELEVGDTAVFINRSLPGREFSASASLRLPGAVTVNALIDYRGDFSNFNYTESFRCQFSNCSGVMNPEAPLWEQARAVANHYHSSHTEYGFIEDASFWKLREISVSWTLPQSWSNAWRASRSLLIVSGRNLATWSGFSGMDPEANWSGSTANFTNNDFFTQPPLRYWNVRLSLSF